jgi:hypothetical protein
MEGIGGFRPQDSAVRQGSVWLCWSGRSGQCIGQPMYIILHVLSMSLRGLVLRPKAVRLSNKVAAPTSWHYMFVRA